LVNVNSELPGDWMEEALKARPAMPAPADFSERMMRRLDGDGLSTFSRFWMDQGVAVGFTLTLLGLGSLVELNGLGDLLVRGMQATPVVVAVVALCASALWLSRAVDEAA
jgi:hypothetical protein